MYEIDFIVERIASDHKKQIEVVADTGKPRAQRAGILPPESSSWKRASRLSPFETKTGNLFAWGLSTVFCSLP